MAKAKLPSPAQARFMARLWSGPMNNTTAVGDDYVDPTTASCIKRGWLVPTGETGLFQSRKPYRMFGLSDDGLDAITDFFLDLRYERIKKQEGRRLSA